MGMMLHRHSIVVEETKTDKVVEQPKVVVDKKEKPTKKSSKPNK